MTGRPDFKYNPGFNNDADLAKQFVVRKRELRLLLDIIADNGFAASNRHVLLIGPRGVGKTTLARRIAAELRLNEKFSHNWIPVTLGEESYSVTTAGEFWLECVYHLQETIGSDFLRTRYRDLREIDDDRNLFDGAISTLIEQARKLDTRFVIIVENLNMILESQMSDDDAWSFRHALQNHPEIMLLATATSSFDQIENDEMALFEQFKVHYVLPLSARECRILWKSVAKEEISDNQVRPIQILTGGNPRLIKILAEFARDSVFVELVNKLAFLIDQYTDYFKSQLEALPPIERKVFVSVLELWDPALTREVATVARLSPNVVSANLKRLQNRGAVVKDGSRWQAAERLFNIYYLMRRRGSPSSRVQALVRFMTVYYGKEELPDRVRALADEACELTPLQREDHYHAVSALVKHLDGPEQRSIAIALPPAFINAPDAPESLRKVLGAITASAYDTPADELEILKLTLEAIVDEEDINQAEELAQQFVNANPDSAIGLVALAHIEMAKDNYGAAERLTSEALEIDPESVPALFAFIMALTQQGHHEDALAPAKRLVELTPTSANSLRTLGRIYLDLNTPDIENARAAYSRALDIAPESGEALVGMAEVSLASDELNAAEIYLKKALKQKDAPLAAYGRYGDFLLFRAERYKAAENVFRRLVKKWPDNAIGWSRLALSVSLFSERQDEANELFEKAISLPDASTLTWLSYAKLLDRQRDTDRAIDAWEKGVSLDPNADVLFEYASFLRRKSRWEDAETVYLRVIDIETENARAWEGLGAVRAGQSDRFEDAEKAFLQAIKYAPDACWARNSLGRLYKEVGRTKDAIEQFRLAFEISRNCNCAVAALFSEEFDFGRSLRDGEEIVDELVATSPESGRAHMLRAKYLRCVREDFSAAEREINLAFGLERGDQEIFLEAARLASASASSSDAAMQKLSKLIKKYKPCEHILGYVAWVISQDNAPNVMQIGLETSRLALSIDPENWDNLHTRAAVLLRAGDNESALALIRPLVDGYSSQQLGEFLDLIIEFAKIARNRASDLISILSASENSGDFEPLIVALRILEGQEVSVAKEIRDVALDIVSQIEN